MPLLSFGYIWPDNYEINLRWEILFNTHIAIFGNTGSGKSNTLAKLYTELFDLNYKNLISLNKSKFILLDFNGEYVGDDILYKHKKVYNLKNQHIKNQESKYDKLNINNKYFWDVEMLSIIFDATEQTQKPFLKRLIKRYYNLDDEFNNITNNLEGYFKKAFKNVFLNPNPDSLNLFIRICEKLEIPINNISKWIVNSRYHSQSETFYSTKPIEGWNKYVKKPTEETIYFFNVDVKLIEKEVENIIIDQKLFENDIDSLEIAVYFQMIHDLSHNTIQYDHLAPLLHRIEARLNDLSQVIKLDNSNTLISEETLGVINLKNVSQDLKLLIPLIIARVTYKQNKEINIKKDFIVNLIIDEAHNILSNKSYRESEKWKDYRLEVFEEIIKERRKFNFYLTIASQRPTDISPTIISQIHNYFIHRLVNDNDLKMLNNTLSTLDEVSKENIPNLAPGQLICTGVSFKIPLIIQVKKLCKNKAPISESASLEKIWNTNKETK